MAERLRLFPQLSAADQLHTIDFSEAVGLDLEPQVEAVAAEGEGVAESDVLVEPVLILLARIAEPFVHVPAKAYVDRHLLVEDFVALGKAEHMGAIKMIGKE